MRIDINCWDGPPGSVRFRPRDEPPEPLFAPPHVNYPGCDGRPRAEDTLHDDWISKIKGGLSFVFRDEPNVFVAADLMWYPVEGNNRRRLAPDVMVALGRPKGHRMSYVQHEEGGVPPQVVFEILLPGNRKRVMDYKRMIYEKYGIEEYYVVDPYKIGLEIWFRENGVFRLIHDASGWVSPRLGIRFGLAEEPTVYAPDGRPFLSYEELAREREESERLAAIERRTEAERRGAEARARAERLAARLRELGLEPDE